MMAHTRGGGYSNMAGSDDDPDGSQELAVDELIQQLLDATGKVRNGFPRTAWGLRSMLASLGLIIVKSPDGGTKR